MAQALPSNLPAPKPGTDPASPDPIPSQGEAGPGRDLRALVFVGAFVSAFFAAYREVRS
jgi:hypothetical protein